MIWRAASSSTMPTSIDSRRRRAPASSRCEIGVARREQVEAEADEEQQLRVHEHRDAEPEPDSTSGRPLLEGRLGVTALSRLDRAFQM